jgi:hypothetical protein
MRAQVFQPDYEAESAVHTGVHQFVDIGYLVQLGLRRFEERQIENREDDQDGKWIFA